ncbi:MAG: ATP-binding protein [Saprospiraceae bacterium]|nr:ATP-binding protein [Saprospiraceae bacterium]
MIERTLVSKLIEMREKYPVLFLTGPRQSGKTTLLGRVFNDLPYFSLEEPDIRRFVLNDPRGFLSNLPKGAILDEAQNAPELFSYIQTIVDQKTDVQFVLSGSQNFLLSNQISQSLAGRTSVQKLLPFSLRELKNGDFSPNSLDDLLFCGGYPRLYDKKINPLDFFPSYIETYVQRDVRLLKNINDLNRFIQFIGLCAGRNGQILNLQSLGNDAGISVNTAKNWLSVLQASYIVFLLPPYHANFNKRIIKTPKLYFYDTGLVASLLGLRRKEDLVNSPFRGALFENFVILEYLKANWHQGLPMEAWFWQNHSGREIDLLVKSANDFKAYEIKSGQTFNPSFFNNLVYWQGLSGEKAENCAVVYGGDYSFNTSNGQLIGWRDWLK